MKKSFYVFVCVFSLLFACTKHGEEQKTAVTGSGASEGSVNSNLVLDLQINVPQKYMGKIDKKSVLVWSVNNERGQNVAAGIEHELKPPYHVEVLKKDLRIPVTEKNLLAVSVRVVRAGEERSALKKGQLYASQGDTSPEDQKLVSPNVSAEDLKKAQERLQIPELKRLRVGDKVALDLMPMQK